MSLKGKTIVVTGGMGALGRVVAETAAARGASVAVDCSWFFRDWKRSGTV